jgi:methyl-accepting chemotaxis protein
MRHGIRAALGAACLWAAAAFAVESTPAPANPPAHRSGDAQTQRAFEAVERLLRGERISELEMKNLDNAVIRIEPGAGGGGIAVPRENGGGAPRNVYILRFDSASSDERQIQLLRLQREILKNQLVLLKSLSAIANYQVNLGTRTARVENIMRDVTLGLKDSGVEIRKIAGDVAGTSAKMTDVANTTADMAEEMRKMARSIDDIEGAIDNVDSMIRRMSSGIESQAFSDGVAMRKIGRSSDAGMGFAADKFMDMLDDLGDHFSNRLDDFEGQSPEE